MPATALTLIAEGSFEDTDGNGWRDTLVVVAYLFAPGSDYPLALVREGEFDFGVLDAEQRPAVEWHFDRDAVAAALERSLPPGPGYVFRLDLRAKGKERATLREGWIAATFTPPHGEPVQRLGSAAVVLGSVR